MAVGPRRRACGAHDAQDVAAPRSFRQSPLHYAARNATTFKGIPILKLDSDPLGSQFPNDFAGSVAQVFRRTGPVNTQADNRATLASFK
jgi:hypothetical protein